MKKILNPKNPLFWIIAGILAAFIYFEMKKNKNVTQGLSTNTSTSVGANTVDYVNNPVTGSMPANIDPFGGNIFGGNFENNRYLV